MRKIWILAAILVMAVAWLWWWMQPEQVVNRRTHSLIELVDLGKVRGVGVMDVHALGRLVADTLQVEAEFVDDHPLPVSRTEAEMAYRWLGEKATHSEFKILGMDEIRIVDDLATVIMRIAGRLDLEDRRLVEGEYQVRFEWRRTEGRSWQLERMNWR